MLKLKKLLKKSLSGFTLMEIIVVMGVFVTTILVVTDIFFAVNRVQRRTRLTQEIQGDARFAMEAMAREVRLGSIAYDVYSSFGLGLDTMPVTSLITRDQEGNKVFYYLRSDTKQIMVCSAPTDDTDRCDVFIPSNPEYSYQSVTPPNVFVKELKFYISPASDPYLPPPTDPIGSDCKIPAKFNSQVGACECATADDCFTGQTCYTPEGQSVSICINANEQPRVTIVLVTETESQVAGEKQQSFMQTTVTSRVYKR